MEKHLKHLVERDKLQERKACWVEENTIFQGSCLKEQIPGGGPSTRDGQNLPEVLENISLNSNVDGILPVVPSISDQIADQTTSRVFDAEILPAVPEAASLDGGHVNIISNNLPSSDIRIFQTTPRIPDTEVPPRVPETISSNDTSVNIISTNPLSFDEQIHHMEITSTLAEIVSSGDIPDNNVGKPSAEEQNLDGPSVSDTDGELPSEVADMCSNSGMENIGSLNHPSGKHTSDHEVSRGGEVLMTASETAASENVEDVITSTEQNRLSAVPSGNSAEIDQQYATVCMAHQDPHSLVISAGIDCHNDENMSGEPEASRHEQQDETTHGDDLDCNAQPLAGTALLNQQVGEPSSEVPESAAVVVVNDDFTGRENDGVYVLPSHCTSGLNELVKVIPPNVSETPHEIVEGEIIVRGFNEVCAASADGSTGVRQTNEVLSDSHKSREYSHINSSPVEPAVALAEENTIPLDQATNEEYCQTLQERTHLDTVSDLPAEVVETPIEPSNQAVLPPVTSLLQQLPSENVVDGTDIHVSDMRTSLTTSEKCNPSVPAPPAARLSATPLPDPLLNELEIIMQETEKMIKTHEDTKLQLKFNCEREIEEEVAKIHRKYEIKLKETESVFVLKKKELDANHEKVLMNKLLAEAFMSKYMDIRAYNPSGAQQEMASSFMHQLQLLSSPPSTMRHSAGLSLAGSPGSLQTSSLPTPLWAANCSLAPSSGIPAAPPHVSSFSPTTGNFQAGVQMRAPPHLQHFRPGAFTSAASLSSFSGGMPSQPGLTNSSTTPIISQLPPGLPLLLHQCRPNMIHRLPWSAGTFPCPSSSSAMELLLDLENQANRSRIPPSNLFPQTHLASHSAPLQANLPETILVNPACAQDIVCLYDDD